MKATHRKTPMQSSSDIENMAKRIKSLRIQNGFSSYASFAEKHGFSRALYGRYEKGRDLRFSTLVRIADAFGMTLKQFFSEGFEE
ncbi:MAG TPA: helix-turn-helix transcriptional regulator [Bacteroidia bacterium]|nr:helix-turn-helix transcriptional regulator [Bacteroidia bacterium]